MKSVKLQRKSPVAAAIAAALMAPGAGQIANAQEGDASLLEEIVVTATRREATIGSIPYNISAVSGEQIDNARIVTNIELMRTIPGASVVDRGHRNSGESSAELHFHNF